MDKRESPGQRARRLLEGTTPGPWATEPVPNRQWRAPQWALIGGRRTEALLYPTDGDTDREIVVWVEGSQTHPPHAPDLALIAAAPDIARDLIAAEDEIGRLLAERFERVRPVVETLASACDREGFDGDGLLIDVLDLLLDMGRREPLGSSAVWLRSLLSTGPDPAHRPTHTDLMVAPESVPDLAPVECPACKGNGWGDALEGEDDHAACAVCRGSGLAPGGAR